MEYGLIGNPLGHSFSKPIHEALGGYAYQLCPLEPEALPGFLQRRDFLGVNVTIPYKAAVIPYLDPVSYTHLDVYKRQPLGGAAETQQGNAGGIVAVNALQGLGEDGAVVGIQHKFLAVQPRHELVKGFPIRI